MAEGRSQRLRALVARQHGHITRAQLIQAGIGRGAIQARVEARRLIVVHRGVYAVEYVRPEAMAQAAAAVLACGKDAVLSNESAAALWGMGRWPTTPHVTAPTLRERPGILTHRCSTLTPRDTRRHHDIRTTSPARTALDIAPRTPVKHLIRGVNDAENAGHLRRHHILDVLDRNPRHPGAKPLMYVVGLDHTQSAFEDDFPGFCADHGLPKPIMNAKVAGYEVDALFPDHKVIVELDSWAYHRDRRSFESNRERDAATLQAGFVTIRITWQRLHATPVREAERMHDILCQRRGQPPFGAP